MILPLTRRQRDIYDWIAVFIGECGYSPSLEEIGQQFKLTSLATVHKHVVNLTEKGYITRRWNCSRSITLVAQGGLCPTCGRAIHVELSSENLHERA